MDSLYLRSVRVGRIGKRQYGKRAMMNYASRGAMVQLALRIGTNIFGAAYTVLCNKLWDNFHARTTTTVSATPK